MRKKLEIKILVLIFTLLIIGIAIAFMLTVSFERKDVTEITRDRMHSTASIIMKAIERSMVEANAEFTKDLVDQMKSVSGYDLKVLNFEGREAFNHKALPLDDPVLQEVLKTGEDRFTYEDDHLHTYMPLRNLKSCRPCHGNRRDIIGAVTLDISLQKEFQKINDFTWFMLGLSVIGLVVMGWMLWYQIRQKVIKPVKSLEKAALKMSRGNLTFETRVSSEDEIGRLNRSIKDSLYSISGILTRIKDVSKRIGVATDLVEVESDKVLEGTLLESEAVAEISSSVEELNVAIADIAESTQKLANSAQESAASVEELTRAVTSIKDITHEVSEGIETTTSSIHQFSASIKEVVENTADLSKVSDETLSAVEEITTTVKEIEVSAKESAQLSHKVMDDSSTLGMTAINKTMDGMEKIRASVSKTSDSITRLGSRSDEIGNILNVIDDITDQTTLLALNAAILAAQAGEHGKGFSVVANEIKDLAERTALSTQEIDGLIKAVRHEVEEATLFMKDSISDVDKGMALSKDASTALKQILESSRKSAEMSASIERTTSEQASTARYVTDAIERVRFMVEHIVKATGEQSKGVQQIMEAAEKMRDASTKADTATEQQAIGSQQILQSVDSISIMSQQISKALNEQKTGSKQIWMSVEKIKDIPEENKGMALKINKALRELGRDVDLINLEMQKFVLYEEKSQDTIYFSVVPFEPPVEIHRKLAPLVEYISEKTGSRIVLRVMRDFTSASSDLGQGSRSLGFLTSVAFVEARDSAGVKPIAKTVIAGKPYHKSAIVTRAYSNISTLKELKGRSFAFVDKKSTSGFVMPKYMLEQAGVSLGDLASYKFYNYHEDVIRALNSGEVDAGAVMETVALQSADKGIDILGLSEGVPAFVVCASPDIDEKLVSLVYKALQNLEGGGVEESQVLDAMALRVTGFAKTVDSDFDSIRNILQRKGDL